MSTHIDAERLYDFEATLRLVDSALDELQVLGLEPGVDGLDGLSAYDDDDSEAEVSDLTPLRVYREVQEGLHSLRHGRSILERTSEDRGDSSTVAATDALTGLDRALLLMERCERDGVGDRAALFAGVREEIRSAMTSLRGQDVTEQRLSYAASILLDMDGRLAQLADMLDPYRGNIAQRML